VNVSINMSKTARVMSTVTINDQQEVAKYGLSIGTKIDDL